MEVVIGFCDLCKRYYDHIIGRCSEFCATTTEKEKEEFKNLQPGQFGVWPCSECDCPIEDEYNPGGHCGGCSPIVDLRKANEKIKFLENEITYLRTQINNPVTEDFVKGILIEAAHQKIRWQESDKLKTDADWFWLIGYLAGKALFKPDDNSVEKQKHRIIAIAAAACNWFASKIENHESR